MADDLFRVLRTVTRADGDVVLATEPISRSRALAQFELMAITWRQDKVRVVREQDFQTGGAR
jgi:hypothetical protein